MLLFGPLTITHGTTVLPDTAGGVEITPVIREYQPIGSFGTSTVLIGGTGVINFYEWPATLDIGASPQVYPFGEVTMESTTYKLTLYSCTLELDTGGMSLGVLSQQPIKMKLQFKPDGSNKIFKLEEI